MEQASENETFHNDKKPSKSSDELNTSEVKKISLERKPRRSHHRTPTSSLVHRNSQPKRQKFLYFVSNGNGTHLVENYLSKLGWERTYNKNCEDYKLRWCEIKTNNNYNSFKEGEQLCYQIPNNKLLTTKIGLLASLQEYHRVMNKVQKRKCRVANYQDFFPETYRLDVKDDRENFFKVYKPGEIWISKPTGMNQGKGIFLIRNQIDVEKMRQKLLESEVSERKFSMKSPMARIIQRYVSNPLLLDGKKFDVRNYLVIACAQPLVAFYRDGYCRLTCTDYNVEDTDLTSHLTNQFMQKKSPLYEDSKDDTVWTMDRFNQYINDNFATSQDSRIPRDWVHTVLRRRCQQVMLHCLNSVKHRLECKLGYFDLIGCDFLIHEDFRVSILEMNNNPALHTNCGPLKDVIPAIVDETLGLVLECFEKSLKNEKMLPLTTNHNCVLLFNGDELEAAERREKQKIIRDTQMKLRSEQRLKKFDPSLFVYRQKLPKSSSTNPDLASNPEPSQRSNHVNINQSKSSSDITLKKPFYAGGSNSVERPYSSPRLNSKYKHIPAKVSSRKAPAASRISSPPISQTDDVTKTNDYVNVAVDKIEEETETRTSLSPSNNVSKKMKTQSTFYHQNDPKSFSDLLPNKMRYNSMTSLSLKGITGSSIPKKELYLSKKLPTSITHRRLFHPLSTSNLEISSSSNHRCYGNVFKNYRSFDSGLKRSMKTRKMRSGDENEVIRNIGLQQHLATNQKLEERVIWRLRTHRSSTPSLGGVVTNQKKTRESAKLPFPVVLSDAEIMLKGESKIRSTRLQNRFYPNSPLDGDQVMTSSTSRNDDCLLRLMSTLPPVKKKFGRSPEDEELDDLKMCQNIL